MEKSLDCVVVGSCVVDVLARPVPLTTAIGGGRLIESDPLVLTTGGIVSNSGITMARLGLRVAAFTYVGDDEWAEVIRHRYGVEGVDTSALVTYPGGATSTTAVLIDSSGERTFVHCVGAPRMLDKSALLGQLDLFAKSRAMLIACMREIKQVAEAIGISLPNDIVDKTLAFGDAQPAHTTSSLQRDIIAGRKSEMESLIGAVVRMGHAAGLEVPVLSAIYAALLPTEMRARGKLEFES